VRSVSFPSFTAVKKKKRKKMGTKKQKPKEKERNRRTEKGKRGGSHRSQWGFPQNGTKMKRNKSKKW